MAAAVARSQLADGRAHRCAAPGGGVSQPCHQQQNCAETYARMLMLALTRQQVRLVSVQNDGMHVGKLVAGALNVQTGVSTGYHA